MTNEQMRGEFEVQICSQLPTVMPNVLTDKNLAGNYSSLLVNHAWKAYQAATAKANQWMPIADAPEGEVVVVFWIDPTGHPGEQERQDFEQLEDGCWLKWEDQCEYFGMVAKGGDVEWIGPSGKAPYTHFKQLGSPLPPTGTGGNHG